ncbi:flavodoxin family protein [Pseudoramibacter faecis]|uniref:flavodoxin family protein n=1 Tax=Pseudoramibacter faecis TaxID=3108534 RepID=UPI002E7A0115|nr:flavodoxin family protein [Pseudoramibacter sp. HA2172]
MKVLLVNGSPHAHGCTDRALREVAAALEAGGVSTDFFWIENKPVPGCLACGVCRKKGRCVYDDLINHFVNVAKFFDGFVFGSPVYFASASGQMTAFMDRVFYSCYNAKNGIFDHKPVASVASCRRARDVSTLDQMNHYYGLFNMPVVGSSYWNEVHGFTAADVEQDAEGLQTLRNLGRNMAWLLKCIELGQKHHLAAPEMERGHATHFIRR